MWTSSTLYSRYISFVSVRFLVPNLCLNVGVAFCRSWHCPPEPRNSVVPSAAFCQAQRFAALCPRLSTWSLDSALYFFIHREWLVLLCLISCSSRYSSLQTNTLVFDVLYTRHCLLLVLLLLLLLLPTIFLTVVRGQSTFSYHLFYNVRCTAHVSCLLISRMIACIRSLILRASLSLLSCIHLFCLNSFFFFLLFLRWSFLFLIPTLLSCALSVSDFHLLLSSCCLCFAVRCCAVLCFALLFSALFIDMLSYSLSIPIIPFRPAMPPCPFVFFPPPSMLVSFHLFLFSPNFANILT